MKHRSLFNLLVVLSLALALWPTQSLGNVYAAPPATGTASGPVSQVTAITGFGCSELAIDPARNLIFASQSGSDQAGVIDGMSDTLVATIQVGSSPWGIGFNPNNNRVYVANQNGPGLSIIDSDTQTVVETLNPGTLATGVLVDAVHNLIYVGQEYSGNIWVIDGASDTQVATIDVGVSRVGLLALNPSTEQLYVANNSFDPIRVVDTVSRTVVDSISVDHGGHFAVDEVNDRLYFTQVLTNRLAVIDLSSNTVVDSVLLDPLPLSSSEAMIGVAYNPNTNHIFVSFASDEGGHVVVLNAATLEPLQTLSGGNYGLAVNDLTNKVYACDTYGSGSIFVYQDQVSPPPPSPNNLFVDSGQRLGNSVGSWSVALGDLEGDGDLDAFVVKGNFEPDEVWLNNGAGYFTDSGQRLGDKNGYRVALGDLDADGDLDAFVANWDQNSEVWLNDGAGVFTDSGQSLGSSLFNIGGYGNVGLGDLDGDGDLDAFVKSVNTTSKVWMNNGAGTFSDSGQDLSGADSGYGLALGDLDSDGDLDAVVTNWWDLPTKVWLNDGSGAFTDSGQNLGSMYGSQVKLGDLDDDGDLDAFLVSDVSEPDQVWLNNGAGEFSDSGQRLANLSGNDVALGDVNGDGSVDAVVVNGRGDTNRLWLNDGTGVFSETEQDLGGDDLGVALGDLDGDSDLDIFIANYAPNTVWLNNSNAAAITRLVATTSTSDLYPGDSVSVDLSLENADNLYAAQATCTVDPAIVQPSSGAFGNFFDPVNRLVGTNNTDASTGSWTGAISQRSPAAPLAGDGLFATVTYTAQASGATTISCDPLLANQDGFTQPVSFSGTTITVLSFANANGSAQYQGRVNHGGITLTAIGPETFTTVTDSVGNFILNLKTGTYTLTASAEGYLSNSMNITVTSGQAVNVPDTTLKGGSVNGDNVIDIGDATLVAANFGLTIPPGDARADINGDGIVNVQDLAILGSNYGLTSDQTTW